MIFHLQGQSKFSSKTQLTVDRGALYVSIIFKLMTAGGLDITRLFESLVNSNTL